MWSVKITVRDLARKEISLVATRIEGEDARSYSITSAIIETAEQKSALLDKIWSMYQDELSHESDVAEIIGQLELQAETNLNTREV